MPAISSGTTRYTITASAGAGGKISPSGSVRVSRNSDKTFTITANEGYVISDVLVDGKSVGAVEKYTFEKVRAKHTIEAVFALASRRGRPGGYRGVRLAEHRGPHRLSERLSPTAPLARTRT